jgi:hypothetical protein
MEEPEASEEARLAAGLCIKQRAGLFLHGGARGN